jgi:rhodanese-related sulfurtransferase
MTDISVEELNLKLKGNRSELQLIDVRETKEIEIAHIEGFTVLPLSQYEEWSPQIAVNFDPSIETLVLCHHGVRSAQMCLWLRSIGFTNVKNIVGGIDSYSLIVDSTIKRY